MQAPIIEEQQGQQMTPEQQAMMMQQQQQQAQQQQQLPQEQTADEVQLAKEALGLNEYEQQLQAMQQQLAQSKEKAIFEEVSSKYKDVDTEVVNKEIEKLQQENPQMAEMIKSDPQGLDMVFAKVKAEMTPAEKPDEITDSGSAGSINNDLAKKFDDGTASEVDLGDFILEASK